LFWIVQGLLGSQLFSSGNDTLQNFMGEIERFGFIPDSGRIYCALPFPLGLALTDCPPPPLFIQMLARYVVARNHMSNLTRALPLAEVGVLFLSSPRRFTQADWHAAFFAQRQLEFGQRSPW
jgi:alpha,alpha-trehalase